MEEKELLRQFGEMFIVHIPEHTRSLSGSL